MYMRDRSKPPPIMPHSGIIAAATIAIVLARVSWTSRARNPPLAQAFKPFNPMPRAHAPYLTTQSDPALCARKR
nr:hypothetical protein [Sphingomonas sp. Y38-1Y]